MYFSLDKNKKIKNTISLGDDRFLDVAEDGTIVGVEVLLPKNLPLGVKEAFLRSKNEIEITS